MKNISFATALLTLASTAFAHDGHGLLGSHWHATDTVGLLLVAGVAMLAVWFTRGGKG